MQYVSIVFTIILIVVSYVGTIYQFWKKLLFALKHWNGHFLRFHVSRETGDITDWFSLTKSCDSQTINVLLSLSLSPSQKEENKRLLSFISFHLFFEHLSRGNWVAATIFQLQDVNDKSFEKKKSNFHLFSDPIYFFLLGLILFSLILY